MPVLLKLTYDAGTVAMDFGLLDGRVVGFEFQMASACLPAELLLQAERVDGQDLSRAFEARILRRQEADSTMGGSEAGVQSAEVTR